MAIMRGLPFADQRMTAHQLPRHEYTLRDVISGAVFVNYANELSATFAVLSVKRVLLHLRDQGFPLDRLTVSTDNGAEFGGQEKSERLSGFPAVIRSKGATHCLSPPATPNAHADVESFDSFIESEFLGLETFQSRRDFFAKVTTYQRWWNFGRPNYSKGQRTPAKFLAAEGFNPSALLLDPLDLDAHFHAISSALSSPSRVGQEVSALPAVSGFRKQNG